MSIELEAVCKTVLVRGKKHALFDNLNLRIEEGARVGILGLPKTGKSTLLRMICGTERPDKGTIRRGMTVSWPIPLGDFFVRHSSMAWNLRAVARLYGIRDEDFPRRIAAMAGLTKQLNLPLAQCPGNARSQLAFALGIGMDFDLYLFENQAVPPRKEFKEAAESLLKQRTAGRAIVLATGAPAGVEAYCDSTYVLEQARATYFAKAKEGSAYFKSLQKAEAEHKLQLQEQQESADDSQDMSVEAERELDIVASAF